MKQQREMSKSVKSWIVICVVVAMASLGYRILDRNHLEQSSLLFIGIPLFLSIALACAPKPKSATGVIMKGITLALLLSGILLIEGVVCILMAAPLFYLVGGVIGHNVDRAKERKKLNSCIVGVLLVCSLEGVVDALSFERAESVTVECEVELPIEEARELLIQGPQFDLDEIPAFFRLGFPLPQSVEGRAGEKVIHFAGGEGEPGDLVLRVEEQEGDMIKYTCVRDESHIAHWLDWKTITWSLREEGDNGCVVQIEMKYDRLLDPAWYFKPLERYGVKLAGEYLVDQTFE